jgi:hypothetical protein
MILNDDALVVAPKYDSKDMMFMFDPPYEQGGGYGIGTTNEELVSGGIRGGATKAELAAARKAKAEQKAADKKAKADEKAKAKVVDENERLTAANEKVFPFRKFVKMCDDLKGKWMVTINGSVRILNEFRANKNPVYAAKLWVKNKVGSSWRFEIVYANYEFKDSLNVRSEELKTAPEYMIFSSKKVVPITYNKRTLPHEDNAEGAIGVPKGAILKPKDESKPDKPERPHPCVKSDKRKPPISNSILPLTSVGTEEAVPAKAVKKPRKAKETAETAVPVNEIVEATPAKKPRKPRAKKEPAPAAAAEEGEAEAVGSGYLADNGAIRKGMIGGYYSPNRPTHLGSKLDYTPSVGYGGSEYNSIDW